MRSICLLNRTGLVAPFNSWIRIILLFLLRRPNWFHKLHTGMSIPNVTVWRVSLYHHPFNWNASKNFKILGRLQRAAVDACSLFPLWNLEKNLAVQIQKQVFILYGPGELVMSIMQIWVQKLKYTSFHVKDWAKTVVKASSNNSCLYNMGPQLQIQDKRDQCKHTESY